MNGLSREQIEEFGKRFFNTSKVAIEPVFINEEDASRSIPDLGYLIYAHKFIVRPRTNMIASTYSINLYDKQRFRYGNAITLAYDAYDGTHMYEIKTLEDVFINQLVIVGSICYSYWGYQIRPVYS